MKIIVFEGIDASGKETQVKMLKDFLVNKGYSVRTESFPRYGTPVGDLIGEVLRGEVEMNSLAFHLLYEVDRLDFQKTILDYNSNGVDYMILDRYVLSNIIYMMANGLGYSWLNSIYKEMVVSNFTIILNISAETSFNRRELRGDLFESNYTYLDKVSNLYSEVGNELENALCIKSDELSPQAIHETVKRKLVANNMI